jgi:hypothetical protein
MDAILDAFRKYEGYQRVVNMLNAAIRDTGRTILEIQKKEKEILEGVPARK